MIHLVALNVVKLVKTKAGTAEVTTARNDRCILLCVLAAVRKPRSLFSHVTIGLYTVAIVIDRHQEITKSRKTKGAVILPLLFL